MAKRQTLAEDLSKQFWHSVDQKIRQNYKMQCILYHYTGLDSLMGMIETNKLWMSKGTFLNDSKELVYTADIFKRIIGKIKGRIVEKYGDKDRMLDLEEMFVQELKQTLNRFMDEIQVDGFEVYILSLTQNKDSLALWYHYARGEGYNIGFSAAEMLKQISGFSKRTRCEDNLLYGQVIYDKQQQEKLLMDFFMETFDYIFQNQGQLNLEEVLKELPDHFFSILTTCSIFFKDEAYKSEEEYRIAYPLRVPSEENPGKVNVFFRSQQGVIIPYIMINFEGKLPISHVTIGPKNNIDVAKSGIEYYLKSKGYDMEKIQISKSVAALRY